MGPSGAPRSRSLPNRGRPLVVRPPHRSSTTTAASRSGGKTLPTPTPPRQRDHRRIGIVHGTRRAHCWRPPRSPTGGGIRGDGRMPAAAGRRRARTALTLAASSGTARPLDAAVIASAVAGRMGPGPVEAGRRRADRIEHRRVARLHWRWAPHGVSSGSGGVRRARARSARREARGTKREARGARREARGAGRSGQLEWAMMRDGPAAAGRGVGRPGNDRRRRRGRGRELDSAPACSARAGSIRQ